MNSGADESVDFKKKLYDSYVSQHTGPRKGIPSVDLFRRKGAGWDKSFAHYLPTPRTSRIADLGCGDGALLWWIQSRGYTNTVGIDISQEQIDLAASLGVKNTLCADVFAFLAGNKYSFDALIMRDMLEHLTKAEIFTVLKLISEALRPGGRLIVQVPNGASPFVGAIRYGDITHELAFTPSSLSQLFRNFPFTDLEFHAVEPVGLSFKSKIRVGLWKIWNKFLQFGLSLEIGPGHRILTQNLIAIAYIR